MSVIKRAAAGTASRRTLVGGVVGLGVGAPLVAACGSDSSEGSDSGSDAGGSNDSGGTDGSSSGGTTSSGGIAKTSDVPVGSGKIFKSEKVVVTQPKQGEFKAFSSICTHQGCPVTKIEGEDIECTCHGSKFSIADGSVTDGPADEPLSELTVTVSGQDISVS